jgi:hypothetical protein
MRPRLNDPLLFAFAAMATLLAVVLILHAAGAAR